MSREEAPREGPRVAGNQPRAANPPAGDAPIPAPAVATTAAEVPGRAPATPAPALLDARERAEQEQRSDELPGRREAKAALTDLEKAQAQLRKANAEHRKLDEAPPGGMYIVGRQVVDATGQTLYDGDAEEDEADAEPAAARR